MCLADSYAFCGFALLYAQNTVWLDVLAWFPVLLLARGRCGVRGGRCLFTLALAAMVVLNFYLSAMVFFWLVLAAGAFLWVATPKAAQGPRLVLLGLSVAVALLLTGVVWLPSLFQYLHSGRTGSLVENLQRLNLFTRLNTTLPVWLCTALSAAAIPLYLSSGRKTRTATALFCVDLLLLLPVWFDPIDAMVAPRQLPGVPRAVRVHADDDGALARRAAPKRKRPAPRGSKKAAACRRSCPSSCAPPSRWRRVCCFTQTARC